MTDGESRTADGQAENWTWGDPCPECGAERYAYTEKRTSEAIPTGDGGIELGDVFAVEDEQLECAECWHPLPVDEMPS